MRKSATCIKASGPPKPPDLPAVKLSGFQKIGAHMKVYLAIPAKDPKDTAYLSLQQGEKGSDVEILAIRAEAGLTQGQLAKLVGTTASVICRLEDADYEGHSLAMLNRIAAALDRRVEIKFVPLRRARSA